MRCVSKLECVLRLSKIGYVCIYSTVCVWGGSFGNGLCLDYVGVEFIMVEFRKFMNELLCCILQSDLFSQ